MKIIHHKECLIELFWDRKTITNGSKLKLNRRVKAVGFDIDEECLKNHIIIIILC